MELAGWAELSIVWLEPMLGSVAGTAARKMILGFFEARDVNEARGKARWAWERHHQRIREMVPSEMLLEYRMGDGWGPLCKFLRKPLPEVEFPRVNDGAMLKELMIGKVKRNLEAVIWKLGLWVAVLSVAMAAAWVFIR